MRAGAGGGPTPDEADRIIFSRHDDEWIGGFYDIHVDGVLRYFYTRTLCAETSADLAAETFAAAFVSHRRFRDEGSPGARWVLAVARRQLGHYLRREQVAVRARRRLGVQREPLGAPDIRRIEAQVAEAPLLALVRLALEGLPPPQAAAVGLRFMEDVSFTEVASRLGCSEGSARVLVARGLATLHHDLGGSR